MNSKIMLYVALMIASLYAMPDTLSLFVGQHTFYNGIGVRCEKCHSDIQSEMNGYVYEKHKEAAGNPNYTTYLSLGGIDYSSNNITSYDGRIWSWNATAKAWQNGSELKNVSLDINRNGIIDGDEICMLCHNATLSGTTAHGVTVRVCDDDRCHGNRNGSLNNPEILGSSANITAAGYNLSRTNVHQSYYLEAGNQSSRYVAVNAFGYPGNAKGSFISKGYWACEGCHTDIIVNVSITPSPLYSHSDSNPVKKRY